MYIYNAMGKLVKKYQWPDNTLEKIEFTWNGLDDSGNKISTGTYFV
jgi:flagellar hook assembly protein FlgD